MEKKPSIRRIDVYKRQVVNDRLAVILDFQKMYLSAWALGLLAFLELLGWRRLFVFRREEREKASGTAGTAVPGFRRKWDLVWMAAAFQAVLKAGILWAIRKPLMDNDGMGRQHLPVSYTHLELAQAGLGHI